MALEPIGLAAVLDDKNFQAGLKRYTSGIGQMTSLTDGAAKVLSGAFVAATGLAVAGIGAVVAASKIGLDATLQWAEGLDKLGDQFGMSGEVASGWQFLMNKVGLSIDEGAQGLNYFTKQLDDFGKASKTGQVQVTPFMTALQKLGVNAYDAKGKLKDFDTIMPEIMDQFEKLPSGVQASALAMDLFGARGGTKFLDFLRQGGKGLKDATAAAKALGLELSTDEVNAAEEFGFAMNELNLGLLGVKNTIGRAVLPIAKQFVEWLNRNAIPKIVDLAKKWVPLFSKALDALGDILGNLTSGRGLNALFRFYYLLEDIFGRDTAKKIYDIMTAVGAFKDSIVALAQRLQGAFQVGGLGGLGGQIARELQRAWPAISTQLKSWGTQFWDWLTGPGGALAQAAGKISEFAGKVGPEIQKAWPKVSAQFVSWRDGFWDWLTGKGGALEQAGDQIGKLGGALATVLTEKWNTLIAPTLSGWAVMFWGWLSGPNGAIAKVGDAIASLLDAVKVWVNGPDGQARIAGAGEALGAGIANAIRGFFEKDETQKKSTAEALGAWLGRVLGDIASIAAGAGKSFAVGIGMWIGEALRATFGLPPLTEEDKTKVRTEAENQKTALGKVIDDVMGKGNLKLQPIDFSSLVLGWSVSANQTITEMTKDLQSMSDLLPHSLAKTGPLSVAPDYTALFDPLITAAITAQTSLDKVLQGIANDFSLYTNRWLDTINVFIGNWWITWNNGLSYVQTQTVNAFNNLFNYLISLEPIFYSYGLTLGNQLAAGLAASYANVQNAFNGLSNIGPPPQRPSIGYANGGWVNRTGMALVHRGEYVIPARQTSNISNNNSRTIMPGAIVFQIQGGSNLTEKQLENVAYRVVARVMEAA